MANPSCNERSSLDWHFQKQHFVTNADLAASNTLPYTANDVSIENEQVMQSRCCWTRLDSKLSLQAMGLIHLLLDAFCTLLAREHPFASYVFVGSALISLLSLFAVTGGLCRGKKELINLSAIYVGLKAVILCALTITALAAFIEERAINEYFRPSTELKILLTLLPLFVVFLCIQYKLSQRVVRLIRLGNQVFDVNNQQDRRNNNELNWTKDMNLYNVCVY